VRPRRSAATVSAFAFALQQDLSELNFDLLDDAAA
jgi:hypothetical protein